jgi:hypothetical protein
MYNVVYASDGGKDYALSIIVLSIFVISHTSKVSYTLRHLLFDRLVLIEFGFHFCTDCLHTNNIMCIYYLENDERLTSSLIKLYTF